MANNDHLSHNQPWPTPAKMAPLRPTWGLVPCAVVIAWWGKTPRANGYNFGGSEGVYGPQNTPMLWWCIIDGTWSALMAIHPLIPPKIITACSGGCRPSIWCVVAGLEASFGVLGDHFRRCWPWLWRWLCVFCTIACRSTNHFFPVEPWHIGYCWKALVSSKTILALYRCRDVELKENRRKCADFLHRLANYPRFLTILVSGAYAPMVLMPQEKW